jgi:hypothetical protein
MYTKILLAVIALLIACGPVLAQSPGENNAIRAPAEKPNAEMVAILAADQADRTGPGAVDWKVVSPRDAARRQRVRVLLDAGQLRSADDYYGAAFVFPHGDKPEDHLLAHVFAMASMALGRSNAAWIATATLDRYLQNTGKPQIFGTQYSGLPGGPMTQGMYDTALIPDSLRTLLGVPNREQQQDRLRQMNARP